MPPVRDTNSVKIAVETQLCNKLPYLGEFGLQEPLNSFIEELCSHWEISDAINYALQFSEEPAHYVSENNRQGIKDGTVLRLILSPSRMCEDILSKVNVGSPEEKRVAMERLCHFCSDVTFAEQFVEIKGHDWLISGIQNFEKSPIDTVVLPYALLAMLDLMDHDIISWNQTQPEFVCKVISFINVQTAVDSRVLSASLTILENIVMNSQELYWQVEKQVTLPNLMRHISNYKQTEIIQCVLALVNSLFMKSESQKRQYWVTSLSSKQNQRILNEYILKPAEGGTLGEVMTSRLSQMQQLILNQNEARMNTPLDPADQDAMDRIKELRKIAFESDGFESGTKEVQTRRLEYKKEYKKLGFRNDINPAQDFMETPPGVLALDNMIYFATYHPEKYSKLVLENCYRADAHECPFGRASIEVSKLLCKILRIGEVEPSPSFHAMLFSHEHSLQELFAICIVLLNKTWKEMKATTEDFNKVVSVVRDQIIRSLATQPSTLEQFTNKINSLSYAHIAELWQQERQNSEEQEMQAPPIRELRRQIEPEILELIQHHRLNFLKEGTRFKQLRGGRTKEKFWFCRLSPNHKFLHFDDCDEKSIPSLDDLKKKLSVSDIKGLVTGKDCPHVKEKSGKKNVQLFAFSLLVECGNVHDSSTMDFVAPDENIFNFWVDGINALLRQRMQSAAAIRDLELLLNMEVKLRLLDAEGVAIPQQEPSIPNPPENYNFCYQLS